MWLTRRRCLAALSAAGPAFLLRRDDRAEAGTPPLVLPDTLALRGFDAVTYALDGGPHPGRPGIELSWNSRAWRFASRANRAVFHDAPAVYAPRLAGYDPIGISQGRLVDADALVFARLPHDGADRLYLFRTAENRDLARSNPGLVTAAEARWRTLDEMKDLRLPD